MKPEGIISDAEPLRILENDLRKAALAKRVGELANATPDERQRVMAQIDREVRRELGRRARRAGLGWLLH